MATFESILEQYEAVSIAAHPFFATIAAEADLNLGALWVLPANLNRVLTTGLIPWLASAIARCPDDRIRCIVCAQLFDELGEGEYERCHPVLLKRFLAALEPFRPQAATEEIFLPSKNLRAGLTKFFESENAYEAIIAIMVAEVYAKKFVLATDEQLKRQNRLNPESLLWVTLHAGLEVKHAADSPLLARLVGESGMPFDEIEVIAAGVWKVMTTFLDDVDRAAGAASCFNHHPQRDLGDVSIRA